MITELYVFSPGSFVVAEEWNANFKAILNECLAHEEAIADANDVILFQGGDYTQIYNKINAMPNSSYITGSSFDVLLDCEYYKSLANSESIVARVGHINGEARIIIETAQNDILQPITFDYVGGQENVIWENGESQWYLAGHKFIFLLERDGKLFVKMIATE